VDSVNKLLISFFVIASCASVTNCVVVPSENSDYVSNCEISTDRKTLKIIDLYKETNSYYSISGALLVPISGIVSGTYVAVHNTYQLGKELIYCN